MSEKFDLGTSDTFKRQMEVAGLMLRGAGFGAAIFVGVGVFIWVISLVSAILPPESKQAEDPTPWSYVAPADDTQRAV